MHVEMGCVSSALLLPTLSTLFGGFQELTPMLERASSQKVKIKGQKQL